jgi:hypothetical protein
MREILFHCNIDKSFAILTGLRSIQKGRGHQLYPHVLTTNAAWHPEYTTGLGTKEIDRGLNPEQTGRKKSATHHAM